MARTDNDSWEITDGVAAGRFRRVGAERMVSRGADAVFAAAAQDLLFDRVQGLTAAGQPDGCRGARIPLYGPRAPREVPRTDELWYFEKREDVGDWLRRHGWEVSVTLSAELMAGYGRTPPKEVEDGVPQNLFVSAQRAGTQ